MSARYGTSNGMKYELPKLNYAYNALEPYIDASTMEIHHTKHHQAYLNNLNAVLEKYPKVTDMGLEDMLRGLPSLAMEEGDKIKFRNNAGGHLNHALYWKIMDPAETSDGTLTQDIKNNFGSVEKFKEQFTQAATSHFGSGWAWLARDGGGALQVYSLPNQDSPLLKGHAPVLGLDIWEHAYYLKYQNRRPEYIENWWKVVKILG